MACTFLNILPRDGTNQLDRLLEALQPTYIAIEERSPAEWFAFAQTLAEEINYYNQQNILDGDWVAFFQVNFSTFQDWIQGAESQQNLPAHLTLFISFLRLLEIVKKDLNGLTYRHLDFYYQDILGFKKKSPVPDSVHLLFELANNADQHLLKAGTQLKAGKDAAKREQLYEIEKDVVLNRTKVSALKTVYVDQQNQSRIYLAPVADSLDGQGKDQGKEGVYWSPFGESQEDLFPEDRTMIEAAIGFAIASPILLLQEGDRTIDLEIKVTTYSLSGDNVSNLSLPSNSWEQVLHDLTDIDFTTEDQFRAILVERLEPLQGSMTSGQFNNTIGQIISEARSNPLLHVDNNDMGALFWVSASGEKGWIDLGAVDVTKINQDTLKITITVNAGQPAIVAYAEERHTASLQTTFPTIRLVLNTQNSNFLYHQLQRLQLVETTIAISVNGIQDLIIQNDQTLLDASGDFQPFGSRPSLGASFFIGSQEVFGKQLQALQLSWEWVGLPDISFYDHYEDWYTTPIQIPNNSSFKAGVSWLRDRDWKSGNQIDLFSNSNNATNPDRTISLSVPGTISNDRDYQLPPFEELDTNLKRGFIRLDLEAQDFGHRAFPNIYSETVLTYTSGTVLPKQPYTPELKSIQLHYQSIETIDHSQSAYPEGYFHLEAFGAREARPEVTNYLLPQYTPGTLYIGLEDLEPPQNLSLLFQVLEGSGDPDFEATREDVHWSVLSGAQWLSLTSLELLEDTTLGLQTSGIIGYSIFREASTEHHLLPKKQYWLRATLENNPAGVPKMVAVQAQAAKASFMDQDNDVGHYDSPLAANTIRKLVESVGAIKRINQPYVSFGHAAAETDLAFYTRVSERLRHKQRAINIWDYEHLVLEAFPEVYKVKCINHSEDDVEIQPGKVTVVIIPDLRQKNAIDPLRPRASIALRTKVYDYLQQYLSLFVGLEVINPLYEVIQLDFSVRFQEGYDRRFYTHQLNEELVRFLSPWAFEEGQDIVFGGQVYKSIILDFIEERPYVDFVTNFVLLHFRQGIGAECIGGDFIIGPEVDIARATSPRSILVSAARHQIHVLEPGESPCAKEILFGGIGSMIIETNNIVG